MKIKKIYCGKYGQNWHESLDYNKEIKAFRRGLKNGKRLGSDEIDELYLAFRNAHASINCYEIREIDVPNPEVCKQIFVLEDYENWGYYIHRAATKFRHIYGEWPLVLVANAETLRKLKIVMKDEGTNFECPEFNIQYLRDDKYKDNHIGLILSEDMKRLLGFKELAKFIPQIEAGKNFHKLAYELAEVVYAQNLIMNFDWMIWEEGAKMLQDESLDLSSLTPEVKCKLLTLLMRRDRFVEGSLVAAMRSGMVLRLLKSLK